MLDDADIMEYVPSRRMSTWLPNQHGAWSMVIASAVAGMIAGGVDWRQFVLLPAWLSGYAAYFMFGQYLRAPRSRQKRWLPPLCTYGMGSAVLVVVLVISAPKTLYFAPAFAVLMGTSLWCSWKRMDRSWLNDTVTTLAASLTAIVTAGLGTPQDSTHNYIALGAIVFGYFLGTVFFVKTMIRDRGNPTVYAASVTYHSVIAITGWLLLGWFVGLLGFALLVRAINVPKRWPDLSPQRLGYAEVGATVIVVAIAVLNARGII